MKICQKVRLGQVDSGLGQNQAGRAVASRCFTNNEPDTVTADPLGHGSAVGDIIWYHAPDILLYNAQVFDASGVTTTAAVAAAIDWLASEKVHMINLSLGLRYNRPVLEAACGRAMAAGIVLIASAPARGAMTYPSAYDGVIRATGDARCDEGEISFLDNVQADFGACPRAVDRPEKPRIHTGGASMGTAHISGYIATYLQGGGNKKTVREWLISRAKYFHREHRQG